MLLVQYKIVPPGRTIILTPFFFSVELMADPGKEDFEYSVKVTIGVIDTVSLTELILPCQLKLE